MARKFLARLPSGRRSAVDGRRSSGPFKEPRGLVKGSWGPFQGSRGPLRGPRGPFKRPRGPFKGLLSGTQAGMCTASAPGIRMAARAVSDSFGGYRKTRSHAAIWVSEGSLARNSRFGFPGFLQKIDPGTPLDRRGLPGTSICTKNQHRRPILRPCRGTQKSAPEANSKAISWHPKAPARLPSGIQAIATGR